MRICCVISSMELGGAQRVMASLTGAWVARGDEVTIVTLSGTGSDFFVPDSRIHRVALELHALSKNVWEGLVRNLARIRALRGAIGDARPDVVLSFIDATNLLTIAATRGVGTRVVVAERTQPGAHRIGWARDRVRWAAYGLADAVVVQTRAAAAWLEKHTMARGVRVIPNAVAPMRTSSGSPGVRDRSVIAVGRLSREKGFDLLLAAWASVAPLRPGWKLRVIGEGPERARLEEMARQPGLAGSVEMPGTSVDVGGELRRSSVFVLPSRYEGFPNVLLEALAAGCLCVVSDCPSGPREILERVNTGTLVPAGDIALLAAAILGATGNDPGEAVREAQAARVCDAYAPEQILAAWDEVLGKVARRQG